MLVTLKEYFGFKPGQTTLDFSAEVKELTPTDKEELAACAAKELGYTVA